jgi:hypothetical protein
MTKELRIQIHLHLAFLFSGFLLGVLAVNTLV